MNDPLNFLRERVVAAFSGRLRSPESWTDAKASARMVANVRLLHDSPTAAADPRSVSTAVAAFRRTGTTESFRELKYVCIGAGAIDDRGWCLLADTRLRNVLLGLAEAGGEPRRQMKCMQALLHSYWSFPRNTEGIGEKVREGWDALRAWLEGRRRFLERDKGRKPGWFPVLSSHSNLLTDTPCARYGPDLLRGDSRDLNAALEGLAIPTNSWVTGEAVLSQMKSAAKLRDNEFLVVLPQLIPIATGKAGVALQKIMQGLCVALLVSRYARCAATPEHMALLDAAVSVIGNPWLRRAMWDALVIDDKGRPDNRAREMVNSWLRRSLINDFFKQLSADGAGDTRRLDYWLRFEPFVEDMWFALGANAQQRRGESFDDFKLRARGRLLDLEQTTADNNAFVMRIGEYLAVEFGVKGNAFYLFRWDSIPPVLSAKLLSGKEWGSVIIHQLKSKRNEGRLIHMDGVGLTWEQKFDDFICPLIGRRPPQGPRRIGDKSRPRPVAAPRVVPRIVPKPAPLDGRDQNAEAQLSKTLNFVKDRGIEVVDNRSKDGALWVMADDKHSTLTARLKAHGFTYKHLKGWWKE